MFSLKPIIGLLMVVGICNMSEMTAAQNLRDLAREHARDNPGVPLGSRHRRGTIGRRQLRNLLKRRMSSSKRNSFVLVAI